MSKIIAVAAHKGGQGKTTSVYALAQAFQRKGRKVLAVDVDNQANLTKVFTGRRGNDLTDTLPDAIRNNRPLPVITTCDLDLVPNDITIGSIKNTAGLSIAAYLRRQLAAVSGKYDIILIDCPPGATNEETFSILTISDYVLIPATTDDFAVDGIDTMLDVVKEIPSLKVLGVMITMFRRNGGNIYKAFEELIRERYGDMVLATCIRESGRMKEKMSFGTRLFIPVIIISMIAREIDDRLACITEYDYWSVADELLERIKI